MFRVRRDLTKSGHPEKKGKVRFQKVRFQKNRLRRAILKPPNNSVVSFITSVRISIKVKSIVNSVSGAVSANWTPLFLSKPYLFQSRKILSFFQRGVRNQSRNICKVFFRNLTFSRDAFGAKFANLTFFFGVPSAPNFQTIPFWNLTFFFSDRDKKWTTGRETRNQLQPALSIRIGSPFDVTSPAGSNPVIRRPNRVSAFPRKNASANPIGAVRWDHI